MWVSNPKRFYGVIFLSGGGIPQQLNWTELKLNTFYSFILLWWHKAISALKLIRGGIKIRTQLSDTHSWQLPQSMDAFVTPREKHWDGKQRDWLKIGSSYSLTWGTLRIGRTRPSLAPLVTRFPPFVATEPFVCFTFNLVESYLVKILLTL